jgi:maltose O-acetyltransferase
MKLLVLFIYKLLLSKLPNSTHVLFGKVSMKLRRSACKKLFKSCGANVNIERGANFGDGSNIILGNNSGIGRYSRIPNDIIIGENVMMAPYVTIYSVNHKFDRIDIPIIEQGITDSKQVTIEDDVWIGSHVIITPGRTIKKGTVIAAGAVLTKDFPAYSVVGGNPARLIKSRLK